MILPYLTERDPTASSEGTLDPLGMFPIADSLANRLAPGVRERQIHPRFLTIIAVGLSVCSDFDEEMIASDGVSEPWQVFEWYVVEGLVRGTEMGKNLQGLPGIDKTKQAIKDRVPLNAGRYLKTPGTFGFHGVYRVLSREIGIEESGRLGETGYNLLVEWAKEQNLHGFYGSGNGDGASIKRLFFEAVKDGLEKGAVARKGGWQGWSLITNHLLHTNVGKQEAKVIAEVLRSCKTGYTRQVLDYMVSPSGKKLCKETDSEKEYYEHLAAVSEPDLKELLYAIKKYEKFSRLLEDAFFDCLYCMSRTRAKTPLKDMLDFPSAKRAFKRVSKLYNELLEILSGFNETSRFETVFADVADAGTLSDWGSALLEHHITVQNKKPPNGKAPWFERFDDGNYIIRPGYLRSEGGLNNDEYVHAFRVNPLWSFASDLHMVN